MSNSERESSLHILMKKVFHFGAFLEIKCIWANNIETTLDYIRHSRKLSEKREIDKLR